MRRKYLIGPLLALAAVCGTLAAAPGAASALTTGSLEIQGAGLCISNLGNTGGNAPVELEDCNGSWRQTWYLAEEAMGGFQVHNVHGDGGCIAHPNNAVNAGLVMQSCSSGDNYKQQFYLDSWVAYGTGATYGLDADASNYDTTTLCVSNNGQLAVGSQVLLETCRESDRNQALVGLANLPVSGGGAGAH